MSQELGERYWTPARERLLREWWPTEPLRRIAAALGDGISIKAVSSKASRLGLPKKAAPSQRGGATFGPGGWE